jgi:hypothetical protein
MADGWSMDLSRQFLPPNQSDAQQRGANDGLSPSDWYPNGGCADYALACSLRTSRNNAIVGSLTSAPARIHGSASAASRHALNAVC